MLNLSINNFNMSISSSKYEKELNMKDSDSSGNHLEKNNLCFSEKRLNPNSIPTSNEKNNVVNIDNYASNSYSISENNELFNSLINSKNNKNKELSLLYLINTFGKSFSSESDEKKKIVIDLPKISKNLFSKPQAKSSSSKNLDTVSFQKNLPINKRYSKGGIMNNFFSSIYEKQMSNGKLFDMNISAQKSWKNRKHIFNSGNKHDKLDISPFVNEKYKFGNLFNNNKEEANCDGLKSKEVINDNNETKSKKFNSSLKMIAFGDECNNNINIDDGKN